MPTQKVQREEREKERERASVCWGGGGRERERERPGPLAPLFTCFLLPWAWPLYTGPARSAACSTRGPHSGPWTFLCSIFAGFSLPFLLVTVILDYFSLFYLPNIFILYITWLTDVYMVAVK